MPFYKTKILNREISLEYEKKDEKKIIDSINLINEKIDDKLQNPKYSNGKISDTILLSLLSIELQAELSEKINIQRSSGINDAKNECSDSLWRNQRLLTRGLRKKPILRQVRDLFEFSDG